MKKIFILMPFLIKIGLSQAYQVGDVLSMEHQNTPLISCANTQGDLFLRDYNGALNGGDYTVTLINTFTSWCTYCQQEILPVNQLFEEHYDRGFRVVSFGRQWYSPYSCSDWAELGATYPLIDDDSLMVWSWFGLGTVPQNIILDHNMIVQYSVIGYNHSELVNILEQLLSELPTVSTKTESFLPGEFEVTAIFPNPFNPTTSITLELNHETDVNLIVRDISGKIIDSKQYFNLPAGKNNIKWDGKNFASGLYFFQLSAENWTQTIKGSLLK
ncbi:MAG: T9SS type A sorting domain-containing protein [Candidatus Marinimicrobia bacterium]|jgi:thiol-disulfide isomerase/thioredoxin|nr:T9SS type A sorting domain-containing protein [Candidatus Neomarinimicrobiota bacterium]MBT3496913.1 T9SS type A sorting domain-containing protein [Candidatus Neomarinimicrobiota bacterium]MBT3692643.1 T9SS type A sorting domain-containing protein [Candidatus Neomarinimicrobiota bacterium]MBT3732822.1 T9SS type A sorting domain-containing protein [Candidatus Neomarinimicrobiota bacterium]MBT4592796.1 T9SS type A sorting domain-containing protein [Candidatus Neomarinimicrobiota bacterium]